MGKTYHFIAGLPRTGSTLLSAILCQNSNFHAGISDVLFEIVNDAHNHLSKPFSDNKLISIDQKRNTIISIFDGYYKEIEGNVIFNTNRNWPTHFYLLKDIFPDCKLICCVRDTISILQSYEKIYRKNTFNMSSFYDGNNPFNIDLETRCEIIYKNFIQKQIDSMIELMHGPYKNEILFIDYDDLVKAPRDLLNCLYKFIGQPNFAHDFQNVELKHKQFEVHDSFANIPNMHLVKNCIQKEKNVNYLTPKVIQKYSKTKFWKG